MYRLMIVEDEPVERQALKLLLELNCKEIEVVSVCENGIEAIDSFYKTRPEIVIMDINLPILNGLDAIREMQKKAVNTKFIVISSYNTFNYAKEALKLGVHDFILKPAKLSVILESINSAIAVLENEISTEKYKNSLIERINSIKPIIESDFVHAITSHKQREELNKILEFMDLKVKSAFSFVVHCEHTRLPLVERVKEQLEKIGIACIGDRLNGIIVFFILSSEELGTKKADEIRRLCCMILSETITGNYNIGFGNITADIDGLKESYNQALKTLSYAQAKGICSLNYSEIDDENIQSEIDIDMFAKEMAVSIVNSDKQKLQNCIDNFSNKLLLFYQTYGISFVRENVYNLLMYIYREVSDKLGSGTLQNEHGIVYERLIAINDMSLMRDFLNSHINKLVMDVNEFKNEQSNNLVSNVVNYIQENFSKNITLAGVAEAFDISPFYLCKLIKKQTGKNFTDILTACRIEKAKEFLLNQNMSVKEVTFEVGFSSQNYFTKVFRKYCGLTPSEYKNNRKT
ncbi:MAG TPA: response regulator [Clostridiaceae bacterium]|nr:response regulator [Clostridiaceae bacterium]